MPSDSIVYIVARTLKDLVAAKGMSEAEVGEKAKVSPRTVANFMRPDKRAVSASGKVPSGKLTELEMIARALGVKVSDLVAEGSSMSPPAMRLAQMFDELVPEPLRQATYTAIVNQIELAVTAARTAKEIPAPVPTAEPAPHH